MTETTATHNGHTFRMMNMSAAEKPMLCAIVDTEEEFSWDNYFSIENTSTKATRYLNVSHEIFVKYGITPTYLVDYPIITDPYSAELLLGWSQAGECLVGAQLHPWVNPPHEEVVCTQNSYPCNLSPELESRKLELLTAKITEAIGIAPRVYKAGRYGLDINRRELLPSHGYCVDTSVQPFRSYEGAGGGPNFFGFPSQPFWLAGQRDVLYLPVTQELVGVLRHVSRDTLARFVFGKFASQVHLPGMFSRIGLLERIMLTPEGVSDKELLRLIDTLVSDGKKVFCLSFHSPTLMIGNTPYTRTQEDLRIFLRRIEVVLDHFFGTLGGVATTPVDLYNQWKHAD